MRSALHVFWIVAGFTVSIVLFEVARLDMLASPAMSKVLIVEGLILVTMSCILAVLTPKR